MTKATLTNIANLMAKTVREMNRCHDAILKSHIGGCQEHGGMKYNPYGAELAGMEHMLDKLGIQYSFNWGLSITWRPRITHVTVKAGEKNVTVKIDED